MRTRSNSRISRLAITIARSLRIALRRVPRRALCCILVINLLVWPGLHITLPDLSAIAAAAKSAATAPFDDAKFWLKKLFGPRPRPQETAADRLNHVAHITVNPIKHVLYQQQRMPFTSIATDYLGRTLQGIRFSYSSSDPTKLTVDEMGVATALQPGVVWLTSTAGIISTRVPILILPGTKTMQSDAQWAADQAKLNPDGTVVSGGGMASLLPSLIDKLAPTVYAQSGGGDNGDFGYDELWSDPRNAVGSPRNRITEQTNIGTVLPEGSNFELSIPMLNSPGRGVPVNLSLQYNSRIWSRHGNAVTFNAVNGWPYLGFNLSFGRIVTYGSDPNTKFMLVDPDGTRHYLGSGLSYQTNTYQTNDGTHITYVGNATSGGTIRYNSGTSMSVNLVNNRLLVTGIGDSNGNGISISYANGSPNCNTGLGFQWHQAINNIYDTRGCIYSFVYDSCNNLVAIQAPGQGGTSLNPVTITVAQFNYTGQSISTSFSGLTVDNAASFVPVLTSIYFPVSQTGYTFSYSAYGMIYSVSKRRQMSVDLNGNISAGVESAHATFNYPTTASSLTDAPAFTQRAESPGSANPFGYSTLTNSIGPNTLTSVITPPDAASNSSYPVQYLTRSTDSTSVANGLLVQSEIKNYSGTSFRKTVNTYANDAGGSPQVQSVTTYDDTGTPVQVNYDFDQYGNITNFREFGYQVSGVWDVRRRTHFNYVTDPNYLNIYLRNLVTEKDVYDGVLQNNDANDVLIAKSTFQYDNYSAMGNMENYGGNYSGGSAPPGYNTGYNNQALTVRGNLTGRTHYSDVVNGLSETFNNKRDIFGNMVQEQVSCCNLNTYTFTANTYWTLPDQTIKGDPGGVHLTKLITHDFNTQQTTATTDPNNLQTTFGYDNSGRPTQASYASGASKGTTYNDGAMSTQDSTNFTTGGSGASATTSQTLDGWGQAVQSVNQYGGQVNTTYDPLGRATTKTNPFPVGGSPSATTTTTFDPLGRALTVTLPDGNTTQASYSGGTSTATDQVGRKGQRQNDGLGRLISATEQDSSGGLTVVTNYTYDLLDNLTQVNQGGQIRAFKYDALNRKTFELLPEQTATINDGTGTLWSRSYTYTTFDKVATRTDARGVVTTYGFDTLNRLASISYNTSSAPTVAATNNVTFTYDTSSTSTTQGLLLSISMTGPLPTYQETLSYDSLERVSSRNWTRDGQGFTTGYQYNTGNEPTQITYPDQRVVAAAYGTNGGQVASVTEPSTGAAYVSSISYSVAGQMSGITPGNGISETYTYDPNRLQLTSQKATTSGNTTLVNLNYSYQAAAGQMGTGTTAGNAGQLMAINNNSTINGSSESAQYTYDLERRLVTSAQTSNGASAQRRFAYDRWGNRTGEWDATSGGNQLQNITLQQSGGVPTNGIATISGAAESVYNTPGQCGTPTSVNVGRTGRYVRVQLMGTNYLHLAEVQVIGTGGQNLALGKTATQSSTAFAGTPNRANDGNTDGNYADGSVTHTDFQNQPWWQVDLGSSQQITSVNVWNRTDCCQSRTTNFNVIVSDQPVYGYDAAGNLTYDGVHSYQYDAENRIATVDNGSTAAYAYDYMNRRIKKTVGSAVTSYIWDGGRVLAESGASTTDYVYASNLMIGTGPGNLLGGNGSFTYFLGDKLNTRVLTDRYGNYQGQQSHLPFGEDFAESGAQNEDHLTTYQRDAEAGIDYGFNRHYEFNLGRFMAADPIGDAAFASARGSGCPGTSGQMNANSPQSLNLYGYARNDPINSSDPNGLETVTTCYTSWLGFYDFSIWFDDWFQGSAGPAFISITVCINIDVLALLESLIPFIASLAANLEGGGGAKETCRQCQNRQKEICALQHFGCTLNAIAAEMRCELACPTTDHQACVKGCQNAKKLDDAACDTGRDACLLGVRDKCPMCRK